MISQAEIARLIKFTHEIFYLDDVNTIVKALASMRAISFVHYRAEFSPIIFKPASMLISTLDKAQHDDIDEFIERHRRAIQSAGLPVISGPQNVISNQTFPAESSETLLESAFHIHIYITDIVQGRGEITIGISEDNDRNQDIDCIIPEISQIYLLAKAIHSAVASLCNTEKTDGVLGEEEIICLEYAAMGKTSLETSMATSIPKRNVEYFLQQAMMKLNTTRRTSAITKALLTGAIKAKV